MMPCFRVCSEGMGGALSACRLKPGVYLLEQCGMIGFQAEDVVGLRPLNLSRDGFLVPMASRVTIQPLTSSNSRQGWL